MDGITIKNSKGSHGIERKTRREEEPKLVLDEE
jgi:hypothetical protein